MSRKLYLSLVLILVAVVLIGWQLRAVNSRRGAAESSVATVEVERGPLVVTLPVSGTLESAEETPVRSEIAGTLIGIVEENAAVEVGDPIFQLDTKELESEREEMVRALADAEEALITAESDGEIRVTQAESDAAAARESLKLAEEKAQAEQEKIAAQVKFAEGEMAHAERELVRFQGLAKLNYIPGTRLRQAEKTYRSKQFDLRQQRTEQANLERRSSEAVEDQRSATELAVHELVTARADLVVGVGDARIRVAQAQRKLDEVDEKIVQCSLTAPVAGLAVIETNTENWPERRPYRLGDRMQPGAAPVRIYDFSKMQVRCQIGEMDISRVRRGQNAYVLSSTQDGRRYRARVALVEELAQESNVWQGGTPGKKVFSAMVTLSETDPVNLRPGMTADMEIVLERVDDAVLVPIRAVFEEDGKSVVYRAVRDSFERVPVAIGTRNDLLIEVRKGLQAGERVALARPPDALVRSGEAER